MDHYRNYDNSPDPTGRLPTGEAKQAIVMSQCKVVVVALAALVALSACGRSKPKSTRVATMNDLVFLTRDGCVNTPDMMANMDAALSALRLPHDMPVINTGTASAD